LALVLLVGVSAVLVKEARTVPALAEVERSPGTTPPPLVDPAPLVVDPLIIDAAGPPPRADQIRWFNGRPIRPARTIWMTVTAYSPDARSCGRFADGRTASLHDVSTNAMRLVAADTRLLPFGSLVSIPGYDGGGVVPVLDRGGAIKGWRLDVLFATHRRAMKWGVRQLPVTIWEYADGRGFDDPREFR